MHQKLVPDPFLILINIQNSHCMQEILLEIRYFERGVSKSLKKALFFLLNPDRFKEQSYQEQIGSETNDQLLFS